MKAADMLCTGKLAEGMGWADPAWIAQTGEWADVRPSYQHRHLWKLIVYSGDEIWSVKCVICGFDDLAYEGELHALKLPEVARRKLLRRLRGVTV